MVHNSNLQPECDWSALDVPAMEAQMMKLIEQQTSQGEAINRLLHVMAETEEKSMAARVRRATGHRWRGANS